MSNFQTLVLKRAEAHGKRKQSEAELFELMVELELALADVLLALRLSRLSTLH